MNKYNPKEIEPKWQKFWDEHGTFQANEVSDKNPSASFDVAQGKSLRAGKLYTLIEFPYPSGAGLHVGHPRPFTAMDVVSRKKRMEGYNVLYPIGFDAFGLPTENYAIKTGRPPAEVTAENIATFTRQLKSLGFSFDWSRAVDTTDPKYYKWTQWIFLQLFKHGLAYKKNQPINWCPSCKIGLANEEVVDGKCERCGGPVEKRNKEQWLLAITKYAESLLEGLKQVDYIERAKVQQENWIGRSEGALVRFTVPCACCPDRPKGSRMGCAHDKILEIFTTRPDTLFGATYMVLAPEHPLIEDLQSRITNYEAVKAYAGAAVGKTDIERTNLEKEKTGVEVQGVRAVNPANGEEIPIWVADYVLGSYGTGAIMAVPAHDERDWEFVLYVVEPETRQSQDKLRKNVVMPKSSKDVLHFLDFLKERENEEEKLQEFFELILEGKRCFPDEGIATNSDFLDGLETNEAKEKIIAWLEEKGLGKRKVQYKLRDWVFSRQRYWGEPIPLVYCANCESRIKNHESGILNGLSEGEKINPGWVPLSEMELPLELPKVEKYQPTDTGESPLAAMTEWVKTTCPRCGGQARRETDTMPNWAGSSWYFLRYTDPHNDQVLASKEKLEYWMPVDWYNGGMEHTVLHLLYSRFWNQFLYDIGAIPNREPLQKMREPYMKRTSHGMILAKGGEKMSKSKGNVVNPDEMVDQFGADALRTYIMFMGPFDQAVEWDTDGLVGVRRFLDRVWNLQSKVGEGTGGVTPKLQTLLHQTIKKVTEDIDAMRFNTAVAKLMELTNEMMKADHVPCSMYHVALKLLSPFAPHICEELWSLTGGSGSIAFEPWPTYDPKYLIADTVTIAIQVNGKLRDTIDVAPDTGEEEVKRLALASANVQKHLAGKEPKKVIYVKGKLVSIVV